ncbi:MAG: hypothetical protein H5T96_09505 [Tissierellales bacterium]|nr:hypothetical protein [Tissierellales bacterium]
MNKTLHFVAIIKETNDIATSATKSGIARFLGVSYWTIHRHSINTDFFENAQYKLWSNVPHIKARTKSII